MNPNIPSIDQLKEMPLPTPVSYTPQTWGWWVLLGLLVLAVVLGSAQRYWQWRRDRYRREALVRLAELQQRSNDLDALRELPELLKRVALSIPTAQAHRWSWRRLQTIAHIDTAGKQKIAASAFRDSVAPLGKNDWQAFLQTCSAKPLPADFSQQLALLAYAPDSTLLALPNEQRQQLFNTCKTWVEQHHVAA